MARRTTTRPTLRDRLAATTRDVILDALVAQLTETGAFGFSYYELARRADVSVRTIYRHFPTRDDLLDALSRRLDPIVGVEFPGRDREALTAMVRDLFVAFDANAALILAQTQAGLAGTVRARGRGKRGRVMQEVIARSVPHLPPERRRAAAGVLSCLLSANTWSRLRSELDLDGAQSGDITAWAIDTLWRALEAENERARRRG
jgi:AcrR family transcriptional regulator